MSNYYEKEYDEIFVKECFHVNGINLQSDKDKNDITEYFVFNENESNIIENRNLFKKCKKKKGKKNKEIKVNYNVCSFFSSLIRPDIYSPFGVLKGNNYELILSKDKSKEEEDEKETKKEEEDVISVSSFDSVEEDININTKKIKDKRYFNIETDISVKCKICGEIGHIKKNCPNYDIKFCHRCIEIGHEDKDCDKKKCFKCNQIGHKTYKCPKDERQLIICGQCFCIGHKIEECLINPLTISKTYLKYNNIYCFICGSLEHSLCSLFDRKLPIILKEEEEIIFFNRDINFPIKLDEDKSKDLEYELLIEDNKTVVNENFKNIIFCSYCGGRHRNDECLIKEKFNNKYDEIRKNAGKKIIEKRKQEKENEWFLAFHALEEKFTNDYKEQNNNKIISLDEDDDENECDYENNINNINKPNWNIFINGKKTNKKNNNRKKRYSKSRDNNKDNQSVNGNNSIQFNGGKFNKVHNFRVLY